MSLTLLIVEDNQTQQYVFKQLCERFGYDAHFVGSGEDALSALSLAQYAAVVMDVRLPGISGIETVRQLRTMEKETGRCTPVIVVTADTSTETKTACMQAGMNDFLTKPFKIGEFRRILLRWVYQPHQPNLKLLDSTFDPESISHSDKA